MNMLTKATLALLTAGVLASPVAAATYNIAFTGEIESANDGSNAALANIGTLNIGDAVSGSFMLDTSVIGSVSATRATYADAVSAFSMTLDGLMFSHAGTAALTVGDDDQSGSSAPLRDSIRTSGNAVSGPMVGGLMPSLIQFALGGTNTAVLSSLDIPTPAQIQSLLATDDIAGNLNFLSFTDGSEARFAVSTVTITPSAVPLPAAAPMLLAGLGGIAALRRRKHRS